MCLINVNQVFCRELDQELNEVWSAQLVNKLRCIDSQNLL